MTTVLAITSATGRVGVTLATPDGEAAISVAAGRRHGETLAPALAALTGLSGCPLERVELIAVDAGPGLFTGLRVGVATAKALADALGRRVAIGCSLDLLANPHAHLGRPVVSVVDARRGEVFWARYRPAGQGMERVSDPAVDPPAQLAAILDELAEAPLLVGDGARRYGDLLGGDVAPPIYDHPSANVLAGLAPTLPAVPPEQVAAQYLRGADVRIGWETR